MIQRHRQSRRRSWLAAFSNAGAITVANADSLIVAGTVVDSGTLTLAAAGGATDLELSGAAVTLSGGGQIALQGATSRIVGAGGAAAALTNFDTVTGGGTLLAANVTLANEAGGVVNANAASALIVSTPGLTLTNAGLLEGHGGRRSGALRHGTVASRRRDPGGGGVQRHPARRDGGRPERPSSPRYLACRTSTTAPPSRLRA